MPALARRGTTYDGVGYWRARGGVQIPQNDVPTPDPLAIYHPFSITITGTTNAEKIANINSQGLHVPTDANLVMWPYANPDGAYLDTVFATLGNNDILVLPEATKDGAPWPYEVYSADGFYRSANDFRHYYSMARCTRGILGMGPNTVITTSPSSYSAPQQTVPFYDIDSSIKTGVQHKVIESSILNAYIGNFEFQGRSFGGIAYNGFAFNKGGGRAERIYANACHRGFKNAPNGEAGAIAMKSGGSDTNRSAYVNNVEVECRDNTGARVASSPIMFNSLTQGVTMVDVYGHHAVAGMFTCWTVSGGITYTRVRAEYNGSSGGGLSGHGFNFELCSGVAELVDCTSICNWHGNVVSGTDNAGLHLGGGSDVAKLRINCRNITLDRGPYTPVGGINVLSCQLFGYSPQYGLEVHRYDENNVEMSQATYVKIAGTITAP